MLALVKICWDFWSMFPVSGNLGQSDETRQAIFALCPGVILIINMAQYILLGALQACPLHPLSERLPLSTASTIMLCLAIDDAYDFPIRDSMIQHRRGSFVHLIFKSPANGTYKKWRPQERTFANTIHAYSTSKNLPKLREAHPSAQKSPTSIPIHFFDNLSTEL